MAKLNKTDRAICNEYFKNGLNQTRAYLKYHPKTPYDNARVEASKLFAKPNVKAYVNEYLEKSTMGAEQALARLSAIAGADTSPFVDEDGRLDFEGLKEAGLGFLYKGTQMSVDKDGGEHLTIQLHDSYRALQDLLKVLGKFNTQNTNLNIDLSQLSDEAVQRIANGEDPLKVITSSA